LADFSREAAIFSSCEGAKALFFLTRRRYFFLTRRREGAKKTKARKNGGMSCRCAAIHAAGKKSLVFPHAKARRRLFYPQIPQISADCRRLWRPVVPAARAGRTVCGWWVIGQ